MAALLALLDFRFEITAEDIVAACALVILIVVGVWWRWRGKGNRTPPD
jgi:hypothetical protein